ncbi:hypothetical protein [Providencia alcalifaciens]|uniref:hypothetical protein n=1 Tax=Providencia alcalifaciens TaxID=126385 RepID=UPI002B055574|nr:hypothetical protein [Providencia alcalifaciens]
MDKSYEIVFRKVKGNTFSECFTAFYNGEKYKLVFQKFKRDQVSKEDKLKGIKPRRVLLQETKHYFTTLENVEFSLLPCKELTKLFCEEFKLVWR